MSKQVTKQIGRHLITMIDPGVEWTIEMEERAINPLTGRTSLKLYVEELLQNVVANPKGLSISDFDHEDELLELVRTFKSFRRPQSSPGKKEQSGAKEADTAA